MSGMQTPDAKVMIIIIKMIKNMTMVELIIRI